MKFVLDGLTEPIMNPILSGRENAMKNRSMLVAVLSLSVSAGSLAADSQETPKSAPPPTVGQTPAMSEIPAMKAQGERMATLMEQLSKESNPEIRRRIMAEAMCPQ